MSADDVREEVDRREEAVERMYETLEDLGARRNEFEEILQEAGLSEDDYQQFAEEVAEQRENYETVEEFARYVEETLANYVEGDPDVFVHFFGNQNEPEEQDDEFVWNYDRGFLTKLGELLYGDSSIGRTPEGYEEEED